MDSQKERRGMNNLCSTKCKYCELVILFVGDEPFRFKCMAQKNAPWVYPKDAPWVNPNISECPYEKGKNKREEE